MIFWFSSPVSFIIWEVFHQLILCPVFLPSLFIIGLGDFSPATWPFETHQLPYGARMLSVVFRFSSLVSLIGLRGFLPDLHFPLTIPRSTELASKEGGNCNNVTLRAESFRSGSHVTTIIQTSPWSVWLPPQCLIEFGSHSEPRVPSLTYALDFSSYALDFPSPYALDLASM